MIITDAAYEVNPTQYEVVETGYIQIGDLQSIQEITIDSTEVENKNKEKIQPGFIQLHLSGIEEFPSGNVEVDPVNLQGVYRGLYPTMQYEFPEVDGMTGIPIIDDALNALGIPAIVDSFNAMKDEMTTGWSMDDLNWSDAGAELDALGLTFARFVNSPRLITPFLNTIQMNIIRGQFDPKKTGFFAKALNDYYHSSDHPIEITKRIKGSNAYLKIISIIPNFNSADGAAPFFNKEDNVVDGTNKDVYSYDHMTTSGNIYEKIDRETSGPTKGSLVEGLKPKTESISLESSGMFNAFGQLYKGQDGKARIANSIANKYAAGPNGSRFADAQKLIQDEFVWGIEYSRNFFQKAYNPDSEDASSSVSIEAISGGQNIQTMSGPIYHNSADNRTKEELIEVIKDPSEIDYPLSVKTLAQQIHGGTEGHLRNRSIEYMLNSGPDFFKHMFDIMMICSTEDNDSYSFQDFFNKINDDGGELEQIDPALKGIVDSGCFMVRAGSIEVPLMESETFDMKFLFNTVKKTRSKVKYERKAELKVLMDEPLVLMAFFNLLTNNNNTIYDGLKSENRYPIKFAPYSTNRIVQENIINKKVRLDIIIKHQKLLNYPEFESLKDSWRTEKNENDPLVHNFAGLTSPELPLWWFEDVNFLGQGSDLTFDRDNPGTQEISYPFLFKRCIRVNRQFKAGFDGEGKPTAGKPEGTNSFEFNFIKEEDLNDQYGQNNQQWYYDGDTKKRN